MENDINLYVNLTQKKKLRDKPKRLSTQKKVEIDMSFAGAFIISLPIWILAALFAIWIYS